ncbi:hypothetical protein BU15DRAFT_68281 [Melanogaster broomeanus]|nr:hypothetical protein BU15DRAFT_68281 [Melanogaster broomeanus]
MSAATNLTGTYYIMSVKGTYLTFTDTYPGTNLTTCLLTGIPQQQWELAPSASGAISNPSSNPGYTVKNVKYQTCLLPLIEQSNGVRVTELSTSYLYQFSTDPLITATWHDYDGSPGNDNPVVMFSCCDNNGWWTLQSVPSMSSVSPSSASTTNSVTSSLQTGSSGSTNPVTPSLPTGSSGSSGPSLNTTALTIGLAVGIPVCIIVVIFAVVRERQRRRPHVMGS